MDGNFSKFFDRLIMTATESCLERDVLRNKKDELRREYERVLEGAMSRQATR